MGLRKLWRLLRPLGEGDDEPEDLSTQEVGNPDTKGVMKELDAAIREAEQAQKQGE